MCNFTELCVCRWLCVCMWWKWWSGVSHGGSGFSRAASQLLCFPGEAPVFMGKSQLLFKWHSQGLRDSNTRLAWGTPVPNTAEAVTSLARRSAVLLSETHFELWCNLKSDHALLTVGIISPLWVIVFKYTKQSLPCIFTIWVLCSQNE